MKRRIIGAATALACAAAACQLFVPLDNIHGVEAEAEVDAGDSGPVSDPCQHVRVPPPPRTIPDAGSLETLFFAARTYSVLPPTGERPGFDLDDHCTGIPGSTTFKSSCKRPENAPDDVDYDGGVDNVFSYIMSQIPAPQPDFAATLLNENASHGFFTVVVQIADYNGESNDDSIKLSFITAGDPTCDACDGGKPSFEPGADEWKFVGEQQQITGTNTAFLSVPGYVTNGTVVVDRSGDLAFTLTSGSAIDLVRATLTGKLQKEDGGFTLTDVMVGGTTPVEDVLGLINNFELEHELLCGTQRAEALAKEVCKRRDLRAKDLRSDLPCDALSFAFRFDTVPAKMSKEVREPPPTGCTLDAAPCPD